MPDPPGVLVLDKDLHMASATPAATAWLATLNATVDTLPPVVLAAAGAAAARESEVLAHARSDQGAWIVVHASRLAPSTQVAVMLNVADPAHLAPLLMRAYGLTDRERDLVQQMLTGAPTTLIARRLAIAEDTVQQHLSSVFSKTGTHSRGELVGLLFRRHYEPRVCDNETEPRPSDLRATVPCPGPTHLPRNAQSCRDPRGHPNKWPRHRVANGGSPAGREALAPETRRTVPWEVRPADRLPFRCGSGQGLPRPCCRRQGRRGRRLGRRVPRWPRTPRFR